MLDRTDDATQNRFKDLLLAGDSVGGPANERSSASAGRTSPSVSPLNSSVAQSYPEDEDVDGRQFVHAFSALSSGALALETLRHDLSAAINGKDIDLGEWEATAWEYGGAYSTTPPMVLLQQLTVDMVVAREQLRYVRSEPQRRGLNRVIAQFAAHTAQTTGNLGNIRESYRWWRIARRAADASQDPEVRVWVRGREVIRGLYEHQPLESLLALAEEAMAITIEPGMGTGSVLCGRAQALAMLGRADDARQSLTDLYDLVDRLPARVTSDMDSMFGWPEYRTRHTESFVFTQIGDHARAALAQEQAIPLYPDAMARERTQVQLHRAICLIRSGDPAAGSSAACDALSQLPDTHRIEVVLEVAVGPPQPCQSPRGNDPRSANCASCWPCLPARRRTRVFGHDLRP